MVGMVDPFCRPFATSCVARFISYLSLLSCAATVPAALIKCLFLSYIIFYHLFHLYHLGKQTVFIMTNDICMIFSLFFIYFLIFIIFFFNVNQIKFSNFQIKFETRFSFKLFWNALLGIWCISRNVKISR